MKNLTIEIKYGHSKTGNPCLGQYDSDFPNEVLIYPRVDDNILTKEDLELLLFTIKDNQ
jgi:hypothetical protein